MDPNSEKYKLGYRSCMRPWECFVKESAVRHLDFDGTPMEFFEGKYTMGPMISDCLVDRRAELESYSLMKNIRHANLVTIENFYDHWGCPRFVLSWVDGSLSAWMKGDGAGRMFKSTLKGTAPTRALRKMIIDLCSGFEHLMMEQLYPFKIELNDIYVRRMGQRGIPMLYIDRVEKLSGSDGRFRQGKLWGDIRTVLNELYREVPHPRGIDPVAHRFINYLGVKDVSTLQDYPDLWNYQRKARCLLSFMSNDSSVVLSKLPKVRVSWPTILKSDRLLSPFQEVLDHQVKTRGAVYKDTQYGYLKLCKDVIKHWHVMPGSVKDVCPTLERFIDRMENWNPMIWCDIYEATACKRHFSTT